MNKIFQNSHDKKEKNIPKDADSFLPDIISFWECETKEDKIARNLWLCFTMGLLVISYLIFALNGAAFFSKF
ncbi:MAG: hypothetical protein K2Q34_02445 [Alphaproteobacteria bacterium]|nr:hypothetical protein [Alphaproteobacteria bacterium]